VVSFFFFAIVYTPWFGLPGVASQGQSLRFDSPAITGHWALIIPMLHFVPQGDLHVFQSLVNSALYQDVPAEALDIYHVSGLFYVFGHPRS